MTDRCLQRRSTKLAAGFLCAATAMLQAQSSSSSADAALEREFQAAMSAQDHGDLDKAKSMLTALQAKHPGYFAIDESLGLLYTARQQFAEALPMLKAAAKDDPSSSIAHANLGADYLKLGRNEDAIHELQLAAKLNSNDKDTQLNLGQALAANKQFTEAAEAFGKAVALDPDNSDLRYNWAAVLLDLGDADRAAEALAPIRDQETMPQVQALLGEILEKQGRPLDAVQHFQTAAKLDPSEANVYLVGLEYLKHWTFDQAVQFFEYGIAHYPASQRMLLGLGIARYAKNQPDLAAPIFGQLLDSDPDSTTYADLLGISCAHSPDAIKECDRLERFAEANPKNAAIDTYAAASILARTEETSNLPLAARLLDEAIEIDPKLAEAHLKKGYLLQSQDRWQESIGELETSIALKPESSEAHYRLALAYARTGHRDKASEQIALQKKYRKQEEDDTGAKLKDVQIFLVPAH